MRLLKRRRKPRKKEKITQVYQLLTLDMHVLCKCHFFCPPVCHPATSAYIYYPAAQLPRQMSKDSLMDEERTIAWTAQIEDRDRTIAEQKRKIEELAKQASETRTLRDEVRTRAKKGRGRESVLSNEEKSVSKVESGLSRVTIKH